jgi:ATP-binding cassette subfamily B protein
VNAAPPPGSSPAPAEWRAYRRLWPYLRPYLPRMPAVVAVSLAATGLSLAQPYISKLMIDGALLHHCALLAGGGADAGGDGRLLCAEHRGHWLHVSLSAAMLFDIRSAVLAHLQTLSPRFFSRFRLGDLMSRLNSDVSDVQRVAGDTLLAALANVLFLGGSIALMLWLDWRLFLVGVVLVPLAVGSFLRAQHRLTALSRGCARRGPTSAACWWTRSWECAAWWRWAPRRASADALPPPTPVLCRPCCGCR